MHFHGRFYGQSLSIKVTFNKLFIVVTIILQEQLAQNLKLMQENINHLVNKQSSLIGKYYTYLGNFT